MIPCPECSGEVCDRCGWCNCCVRQVAPYREIELKGQLGPITATERIREPAEFDYGQPFPEELS